MHLVIEKATDLKELAQFLEAMNSSKETHIGYCGQQTEEIYQTLKEDFIDENSDVNFFIARKNNGEIAAAIGLDIDESSAEVWGPFNRTSSMEDQRLLWEQIARTYPTITSFYFFINKENTQQNQFMEEIGANQTGEHLILEIEENNFTKVKELKSVPFTNSDFEAFEALHQVEFPNTYYDAKTVMERLSSENCLRILKAKSGEFQGYAYFEVDLEYKEASLEYIAIAEHAQNQGLGTLLLKEALTEIFSYPEIKEIKLTVDDTNSHANHVYLKAGFEKRDRLNSYVLKR